MKRKAIKLISAIVAIGITSVLLSACSSTPSTPQDVVKGYLEAVQKGDSKTALSLISPNVTEKQQVLLTDEALKSSVGIKSINVFDALTPDKDDPAISIVKASYSLNGKTVDAKFDAKKADDKWVVTSGDAYVEMYLPFSEYTSGFIVAGVPVNHSQTSDAGLTLFPGSYDVELKKGNKLVSLKKETFYAGQGSFGISGKFDALSSVKDDINSQIKTFIESCFAVQDKAVKDDTCPNWIPLRKNDVTSPSWELIKLPTYGVSFDGNHITLELLDKPEYKFTYDYAELWDPKNPKSETESVTEDYAPTVTMEESKLVLTFIGDETEHKVATWNGIRYY